MKAQPPSKCHAKTGHCWVNRSGDGNKKVCKHCGLQKFWAVTRMRWIFEKV